MLLQRLTPSAVTTKILVSRLRPTPTILNNTICTSSERTELVYIPSKMKEEVLALHEEDSNRWTATTLSARFGAPHDNIAALLSLGKLRQQQNDRIKKLDQEQRKVIEDFRDKGIKAWSSLSSVSPYTSAASRRRVAMPSKREDLIGKQNASVVTEEENDEVEVEVGDEEIKDTKKSMWYEYIEDNYDKVQTDSVRKTTFAFIEVGKKNKSQSNIERAVWLRDGATGKLRLADMEEKKLLTSQVKMRDSKAFLNE